MSVWEKQRDKGKPRNKKLKLKMMLDQAAALMEEGCQLKIVGHSLGGASNAMITLKGAGGDCFPSPITAIASGAPKVGNLSFVQTFECIEWTKRFQCIQVANNKDPVSKSLHIGNFDPCAPIVC